SRIRRVARAEDRVSARARARPCARACACPCPRWVRAASRCSVRARRRDMYGRAKEIHSQTLREIRDAGLEKKERQLTGPQGAEIRVAESARPVLNFCANNYLGLSSHPKILEAARTALDRYGFGLSSVRFICGTQDAH